jgi:GT2 family glycosyltransferase
VTRSVTAADAPFMSVVVATRDRPRSLERCLDSLVSLEYPNFELVLVDNAPATDGTVAMLAGRADLAARIRYVREDRRGLASAHNAGVAVAEGEIVAFTDDDVVVDRGWLSAMETGFGAADRVGCVTGLILPLELATLAQRRAEQRWRLAKGGRRVVVDLAEHRPRDPLFPYATGALGSGANMAFRADVLRAVGGFDPAIGTGTRARGGDDLAAFLTVLLHGHTLVYEPKAIVRHEHPRTMRTLRRQSFGYGVGLTAHLTKAVLEQPGAAREIAARAPAGIRRLIGGSSPGHSLRAGPAHLAALEAIGLAWGPAAYLWSRRSLRVQPAAPRTRR